MARRLQQKGVSEEAVEAVIQRLCRAKLLDDEAFARYWISNREQFKPRGEYALRYELRQKGVAGSIIDALLQGADETESAYREAISLAGRDTFHVGLYSRRFAECLVELGRDEEAVAVCKSALVHSRKRRARKDRRAFVEQLSQELRELIRDIEESRTVNADDR